MREHTEPGVAVSAATSQTQREQYDKYDFDVAQRRHERQTAGDQPKEEEKSCRRASSAAASQSAPAEPADRNSTGGSSRRSRERGKRRDEDERQAEPGRRRGYCCQKDARSSGCDQSRDHSPERHPEAERDSEPVPEAHGQQCRRIDP